MKYIIAETIKEGNAMRPYFALSPKSIKVITSPNSIRGRRFGKSDMVYVFTDDVKLWKVLEPALQGASVFCYNLK